MISILEASNPSISRLVHQHGNGGGGGGGTAFSKYSNYRIAISPAALRGWKHPGVRFARSFVKKKEMRARAPLPDPNCTRGDDAGTTVDVPFRIFALSKFLAVTRRPYGTLCDERVDESKFCTICDVSICRVASHR